MGKRIRLGLVCLAIVGAGLLARNAIAQTLLTFQAPHAVRAPAAVLDPSFARCIDGEAARAKIVTADDLVAFSLRTTAGALHFGLSHPTSLSFNGADREANCVEYAELLGTIMNREHGSQDIRAWVVRSDARILGKTIPNRAWKDHDWVLVVVRTPEGSRRIYLDPTLFDLGMGWDISSAVRGELDMTETKYCSGTRVLSRALLEWLGRTLASGFACTLPEWPHSAFERPATPVGPDG